MFHSRKSAVLLAVLALLVAVFPATAQLSRNPLPVPDVGEFTTLKADFHMHTVFSDGRVWPTVRVREAYEQGLDVIAITDHDDYHPHDPLVSNNVSYSYKIAKPYADQLGIILIPGVEVTKGEWHFNALFVKDANATKNLPAHEALSEAAKQGAFVFWNHPGWKQPTRWFDIIAPLYDDGLFQGVELVNGHTVYKEAFAWMKEKHLAMFANSDIHKPACEADAVGRPITLVFVKKKDTEGIREALDARRTVAWVDDTVWGPEELLAGLWKGAFSVQNSEVMLCTRHRSSTFVQVVNSSAIPFQIEVTGTPEWLTVGGGTVKAESITAVPFKISKDAPAGEHDVELELEITNFHTAPGEHLKVKVPFRVTVHAPEG